MSKASTPIRVKDRLLKEAGVRGTLENRSASQQLEHWAELGKTLSTFITPEILLKVRAGLARVQVAEVEAPLVSADAVFSRLEAQRASGALQQAVHPAGHPVYQASRTHPALLEQLLPSGEVRVGRFRNGIFTPEKAA